MLSIEHNKFLGTKSFTQFYADDREQALPTDQKKAHRTPMLLKTLIPNLIGRLQFCDRKSLIKQKKPIDLIIKGKKFERFIFTKWTAKRYLVNI